VADGAVQICVAYVSGTALSVCGFEAGSVCLMCWYVHGCIGCEAVIGAGLFVAVVMDGRGGVALRVCTGFTCGVVFCFGDCLCVFGYGYFRLCFVVV